MAPALPTIVLGVLLTLSLTGLIFALIGWRGRRIDDHPFCRRCGYDLVAGDQVANCPECGSDVTSPGAVRIGHRQRRPWMIGVGLIALVLAGGSAGIVARLQAIGFDWNTIKPLGMLRREADSGDPTVFAGAQEEILGRLQAGRLAQSQIDSIIDESLALQSDADAAWFVWRGDFIEEAWLRRRTGDETLKRYLQAAIDQAMYLRVRPRVRQGQPVSMDVCMRDMRLGRNRNHMLFMINQASAVVADGQQVGDLAYRSGWTLQSASSPSARDHTLIHARHGFDLPLGRHTVGIDATFRIFVLPQGLRGSSSWFAATRPDDWQLELTRRFESPVELLPAESPGVRLVADPSLHMRRVITPHPYTQTQGSGAPYVSISVDFGALPIDVAFDVSVRDVDSGREEPFGGVWEAKDGYGGSMSLNVQVREANQWLLTSNSLEIILKPNPQLAEPTFNIFEIWDGELTYRIDRIPGRPLPQ